MPVKQATIRFRAEGTQGLKKSFRETTREILKEQQILQRSQKKLEQARLGREQGKVRLIDYMHMAKQVEAAERQLNRTIRDISYESNHSKLQIERRLLARDFSEKLKLTKNSEKAQFAIKKAYQIELAKINEQIRQEKLKQTAMEMREMVKAQEQQNKIRQSMAREDLKRTEQVARQKAKIEEQHMRMLGARFGAGGGGGGGAGAHGRWQPGAYKTPQFGSMSDRFTAMFSVAGMVGNVTGDQMAARNVGMAASGFLLGSPLFASFNAGAIAISAAIGKVREETEKLKKSQERYGQTITDISNKWSGLATSLVENNPFGSRMQSQMNESRKALHAIRVELGGMKELGGFADFFTLGFAQRSRRGTISQTKQEAKLRRGEMDYARSLRDAEYEMSHADRRMLIGAQREGYNALPSKEGESRKVIELYNKQNIESLKLELEYKEKIRQADAAIHMTNMMKKNALTATQQKGLSEEERKQRAVIARDAIDNYYDALEARSRIDEQRKVKEEELDEKHRQEKANQNRQFELQAQKDRERYNQMLIDENNKFLTAQIRAELTGYAQQKALKERAYQEEIEKNKKHGKELIDIIKARHEAEREEQRKTNELRISQAMATFDAESALVQFRMQMSDYGAMNATKEQQEALKENALVGNYNRQIEDDRLNLALKRNQITRTEAEIQRQIARNPIAQTNSEEGAMARAKIAELSALHKEMRTQDAQDRIAELQKQQNQRGSNEIGQFSSGQFQAGYIDFKALNQEGQMRELRQINLLEQINEILHRIEYAGPLS